MVYDNIVNGEFIERINRFTAKVKINGHTEIAHIKNTGRCSELFVKGTKISLQDAGSSFEKTRKTRYDLISVYKKETGWINVDSQAPNMVVREWLSSGKSIFGELKYIKSEYNYGNSRLDFYMEDSERKIFLEVKGCTLDMDGICYFPDAPTERGVKHLKELTKAVKVGYECYIAFVIQMENRYCVVPNEAAHKEFAKAMYIARKAGVRILYLGCRVSANSLFVDSCNTDHSVVTIMDFSRIYENEKFYYHNSIRYLDCTSIYGTNCYCDCNAIESIRQMIKPYDSDGIHFIDSGNYHYVTALWLEKIQKEFILVVFDHHSDMQKPLFGDILSCGDWIIKSIDEFNKLKRVILIGISDKQVKLIPHQYKSKIVSITENDILEGLAFDMLYEIHNEYPLYVSIDKDLLSKKEIITDWDQGNISLDALKEILGFLLKRNEIMGMDICGECSEGIDGITEIENNDEINKKLLHYIEKCKG